jgi:release factor glutamine methyltransferase
VSRRTPAPDSAPPPDSRELLRRAAPAIGRAEAEYLLCSLLVVSRHELYEGRPVGPARARRFKLMLARARKHEPVQYITKSAPFLDLDLYVDRRVLIPRPETEELVTRALARVGQKRRMNVVDFGTGSGCIAIAVARALPQARVLAIDASPAALEVARRNTRRYRLSDRVKLLKADNFDSAPLRRLKGRVDLLVANPPYVPTGRVRKLSPTVHGFEPLLALDGGPKGVNIVAMLLAQGPTLLRKGGLLAMEIDWSNAAFVRRHSPLAEVERDFSGRNRYVFLKR